MTRKRFVKLLMARGFDRNGANAMAVTFREKGYSYEKAYRMATAFPNMMDGLAAAMNAITDAAWRMAKAITAGFAAFGEAVRASMEADRKQVEAKVYDVDNDQSPVPWDALREAAQ